MKRTRNDLEGLSNALSRKFLSVQQSNWPRLVRDTSEAKIQAGADVVRKLVEIDGYDLENDIAPAVQWVTVDEFWSRNVLSLANLRTKGRNGETKFVNILSAMEDPRRKKLTPEQTSVVRDELAHDEITTMISAAWSALPEDQELNRPPWVRKGAASMYNTPDALCKAWLTWIKDKATWLCKDGPPSWRYLRATWDSTWPKFIADMESQGLNTK